ncbi:MAG: Pyrimidine 5'-nucleotidase YjjG [Candidatus Erwinia impunctatus]|nr:Pyrimidine 5'-nucleotidase YjjG [Culicoides impunctatus]
MVEHFDWVLFDADDTLFHFDALAGLQSLFGHYGVDFTAEDYATYQSLNKPLWVAYQQGNIDAATLQHQRFTGWAEKLNLSTAELNERYLQTMAEVCKPLAGAQALLTQLSGRVKLGIITNGFTALQQRRLIHNGWQDTFDLLVISEQVGYAKPHPEIFEYALEKMGRPEPDRVLMVGDNPDTDIAGAQQAGMRSCWLDHGTADAVFNTPPTHKVTTLSQLNEWLFPLNSYCCKV